MGFFDFMTRMATGKPIFDDPKAATNQERSPHPTADQQPAIDKTNDRSFPVVEVRRVTTHVNGTQMQIYCNITNTWPEEIMLDKIHLLGIKRELDSFLAGGEAKDFLVYSGPAPTREYHEAQLDYKTRREGDYFAAIHDVSFSYHPEDKIYTVDDIQLRPPIRDIYG